MKRIGSSVTYGAWCSLLVYPRLTPWVHFCRASDAGCLRVGEVRIDKRRQLNNQRLFFAIGRMADLREAGEGKKPAPLFLGIGHSDARRWRADLES